MGGSGRSKLEKQNVDPGSGHDNVISLDEYRRRTVPSPEEVEATLRATMLDSANSHEAEIAEAILEMYGSGLLDVRRLKDGEFIYSLKSSEDLT